MRSVLRFMGRRLHHPGGWTKPAQYCPVLLPELFLLRAWCSLPTDTRGPINTKTVSPRHLFRTVLGKYLIDVCRPSNTRTISGRSFAIR
jgi:hypothetical protein